VKVPHIGNDHSCVWAQYTIRVPAARREALAASLRAQGIPTAMYYPTPSHRQTAYRHYPVADGGLAVTDRRARSSACRCTPISTRRRRTASSRRCAERSLKARTDADFVLAASLALAGDVERVQRQSALFTRLMC
jgi:hypothetical protein